MKIRNALAASSITFSFLALSATAAIPLRWTVETSRVQPVQFEAFRGETLELKADLFNYGKPLSLPSSASLYWQTNGMGTAYWSAPATVESNRLSAVWLPTYDTGARAYNCFLGCSGDVYRAAFQLRLRDSPGATPNALPLPQQTIDFSRVTVIHPPWPTQSDLAETVGPLASGLESVSNTVSAWEHYWDGDDVRFTVTNYFGSADNPALYIEQKMEPNPANGHPTNWFKTVWDERTRLAPITNRLTQAEADIRTLDAVKTDNGTWGFYDSHAGTVAPDGFVSISAGGVILGNGQSWQKSISVDGPEIWTLVGSATIAPGTNGVLRLEDTDGTTVFEVVKGGRVTRGATAAAIVAGDTVTINYVLSDAQENPSIQYCTDLTTHEWQELSSVASETPHVVWSNFETNYTATITLPTPKPDKMFFKAAYVAGEDGYVKFHSPVDATPGLYVRQGNTRVKIVPVLSGTTSGSTVTWRVE